MSLFNAEMQTLHEKEMRQTSIILSTAVNDIWSSPGWGH